MDKTEQTRKNLTKENHSLDKGFRQPNLTDASELDGGFARLGSVSEVWLIQI